jgi:hypothetical protein
MCTQRLLRRLGLPAVAAAVLLAAAGEAARADLKPPQCSDDADSCEVVVEDPGIPGGSDGETTGEDDASDDGSGGETGAGDSGLTDCTSTIVDTDADSHPLAGPRPSGRPHVLVVETCTTPSGSTVQMGEWLELGADGQVQIRPEVLAQRAIDRLNLPQPIMHTSPETVQLVHLPIWLAVTEASWEAQSATASVPGLSVTATATPVSTQWSMGNDDTTTCTGPGTVWTPAAGETDASPDCGYHYEHASEQDLEVSVTVVWQIRWAGGGESGSVPDMTTTAQTTWQVIESQSLVQR